MGWVRIPQKIILPISANLFYNSGFKFQFIFLFILFLNVQPKEKIVKLPELVENPFKERICESFSRDGYGNLRPAGLEDPDPNIAVLEKFLNKRQNFIQGRT